GKIVEADETYYGKMETPAESKQRRGRPYTKGPRGPYGKRPIVALVERGGAVRSFHVQSADKETVASIVVKNVAKGSTLHTDESRLYKGADAHVAKHSTVHHASGEYVRGIVHTNCVEGFFGTFKRG